jgi:DNA mismatch repair protein MutL
MVNGRSIQDRAVVSALFQGYHPLLPKRRYPIAILFLNIPHDDVDINVHPSKKEVRFRNSQGIYELLVRSVRAFLREEPWIPRSQPVSNRKEEEDSIEGREGFLVREEPKGYRRGLTPTSTMDRSSKQRQLSLMGEKGFFSNLHYIGQIEATYLLLASPRGLLLIDQHAAHERVLFEKIKRGRLIKKSIVQPLLMPLSIDLSLRESSLLESYLPYLREVGVEVSPFGGNTWRITALPYWHEKGDGEKVIQDLIAEFMEMGHSVSVEDAMEKVLAVLACHGAIRANNGLQREEVIELLREMDSTPSAGRCPHGRPTYIEIDRQELERRFGRQK